MVGLTQQQLAELVGVSYQQIHKFEKGVNRVSASHLHQFAQALAIDIGYFFDRMAGERAASPTLQHFLLLDLIRSFIAIPNKRHRVALCHVTRALASAERLTDQPARRHTNSRNSRSSI